MKANFEAKFAHLRALIRLRAYNRRPALYEAGTSNIWTDAYLSKGMLAAHLDDTTDAASFRPEKRGALLDFLDTQCPPAEYPSMLDIGCGPGLIATEAARRGRRVTGIDFSARSIEYARGKAEESGLPLHYIHGDYLTTSLRREGDAPYDVAIMISYDLTVLTAPQRALLLRKACESLRPGGALLLDVFTTRRPTAPEGTAWEAGDGGYWSPGPYLLLNRRWHYKGDIHCTQHIVLDEGGVRSYHVWEHLFTPDELTAELRAAGFADCTFYADHTGAPWKEDCRQIYALARK